MLRRLVIVALLSLASCAVASRLTAAPVVFNLDANNSYIDMTVQVTDIDFLPGVHTSTTARTRLSGQMTVDLTGPTATIAGAQFTSADIDGTTESVTITFPGIGPVISTLTTAHYNLTGPVEVVTAGSFEVGNSVGIIDGGVLTFPLGLPPHDFGTSPRNLDLLPGNATVTGSLTPGSMVTVTMPIQFADLQMLFKNVNGSPGNGYIDGVGSIVAQGQVPIPEPTSWLLAVAAIVSGAYIRRRAR